MLRGHEGCPAGCAAGTGPVIPFFPVFPRFPRFPARPRSFPAIMAARGPLRERAPPHPCPAPPLRGGQWASGAV